MSRLHLWLQENQAVIIESWADPLAKHPLGGAGAAAENFFTAVLLAARQGSQVALNALLKEWNKIAFREPGHGVALLVELKMSLHGLLMGSLAPENALTMIQESETVFGPTMVVMAALEAESHARHAHDALETVHSKTQRLDKHKTDFISVASHELKTPLTLIEGYANMLRSDLPEAENPRPATVIKGILGGTQRLREIIEDMIDVSLLDMGMLDLNLQPVWIPRLLNMVSTEMGKIAEKRQIMMQLDEGNLSGDAIQGDPERLFQVLVKVVENAIKYTPDGGTIHINAKQTPEHVEISVRDDGIGLNTSDFELIFEKFYSLGQVGLHSSSKIKFKGGGPGLGLAIARGLIEAHGGKIWVESRGHDEQARWGSMFTIQLPIRPATSFEALDKPVWPATV